MTGTGDNGHRESEARRFVAARPAAAEGSGLPR